MSEVFLEILIWGIMVTQNYRIIVEVGLKK